MFKIKIRDPTRDKEILFYHADKYEIDSGTIKFIDRFNQKHEYNLNYFIGAEEVKE